MTLFPLSQLGLASAVEHLMFAIVPGGLVVLLSPLTRKNFRLLKSARQGSTWVSKALPTVAAAMLALELGATVIWRFAPGRSDSSFPAAVLSLVASLSVCAVLRSELAATFQPVEYPLYLLGATLVYDIILGRQCHILGHWHFSQLHYAITMCKFALIILGYASIEDSNELRQPPCGGPLLPLFRCMEFCSALLSDALQYFLVSDLSKFTDDRESVVLFEEFMDLWETHPTRPNNSIMKACVQVLHWRHATYLVIQLCSVALNLSWPFVFKYVMAIQRKDTSAGTEICSAAFATSMVLLLHKFIEYAAEACQNRIFASTKALLMTAIYEKSLRLSSETLAENPTQALLSSEIDTVVARLRGVHGLIQKGFALPIVIAILYHLIGIACLVIIPPFLIISWLAARAVQGQLPKIHLLRQMREDRIKVVTDVLTQLKNIKMMGLSDVLSVYLERRVAEEVRADRRFWRYTCLLFSLSGFIFTMSPIFVLGAAWYFTSSFVGFDAIDILQFFLVTDCMTNYIVDHEFRVSEWHRGTRAAAALGKFLALEELGSKLQHETDEASEYVQGATTSKAAVLLVDATISGADHEVILQDVTLEIRKNDIAMVSGPVGCGKTTLLRAILGEMKPVSGHVSTLFTAMAYCAQTTWIPPVTIREIILAGCPYVLERYRAVLIACCLDADLMLWPDADLTSAKTSGFSFTRSLKQRLALARALYAQASLLILDDALSYVDRATSESIANNLFGSRGLVRTWDCTVVMATNSLDQLRHADVIFEIKYDHEIWEHQSFAKFISSEPFPEHVDVETDIYEPLQTDVTNTTSDSRSHLGVPAKTVIHGSFSGHFKTLCYLLQPEQWNMFFLWLLFYILAVLLQDLTAFFSSFTLTTDNITLSHFGRLLTWGMLSVMSIGGAGWVFLGYLDSKIIENLFSRLIRTAMNASPHSISTMDLSYLLELFNHDFSKICHGIQLPFLQLTFEIFASVIDMILITVCIDYGFFSILLSALFVAVVQPSYAAASSQVSELECQMRTSLNTHLASVEAGIEHVRAFGRVHQVIQDGRDLINGSQRSKYYELQSQSRLALLCALYEAFLWAIVVTLGLVFADSTSALTFAFALYRTRGRGDAVRIFVTRRHSTEEHLACVSRIKTFCEETPVERDDSITVPVDGHWPAAGGLDFHHATITPADEAMIAGESMKDVSISVEPGEKVGLAGAPDQGQSSVILAVLRMVDYTGNISIDGCDIKSISRELLRSQITTVTEDGIAITGSVRLNLDPYSVTDERFSDDDLISMLTRVRLWDIVRRRGGLDADISRMKFSKGHLQLLNLGRGALHKRRAGTKIVLIDEATNSLDADTEFQMSDFMDGEFAGATMLIVAQRLQCFETADAVLMMREGRVDSILRQDEDTGEWYEDFEREESGASSA